MAQLPSIFVEDMSHHFVVPHLTDEEFGKASSRFVKVAADTFVVDEDARTIYLARRIVHSMKGWWTIGGGVRPGENFAVAAARTFARDTGLNLEAYQFEFVMYQRIWSAVREETPQEAGEDSLTFQFAVALSTKDLLSVRLNSARYDVQAGLQGFGYDDLLREQVRMPIIEFYNEYFSQ